VKASLRQLSFLLTSSYQLLLHVGFQFLEFLHKNYK